jgi:hypothetical protein
MRYLCLLLASQGVVVLVAVVLLLLLLMACSLTTCSWPLPLRRLCSSARILLSSMTQSDAVAAGVPWLLASSTRGCPVGTASVPILLAGLVSFHEVNPDLFCSSARCDSGMCSGCVLKAVKEREKGFLAGEPG